MPPHDTSPDGNRTSTSSENNGQVKATSPLDRLPPQNLEAERGMLGGILQDNTVLADAVGLVRVEDLYRGSHQVIYRAILDLHAAGQPIDTITLVEDLARRDQLQTVGGQEAISAVLDSVPHAANTKYYAGIVREKAIARGLIEVADQALRDAYSNDFTAEQLLGRFTGRLAPLAAAAAGAESPIIWGDEVIEREIEWLWRDRAPHRKVWVVAGPGGLGKSFILCDLAARVSIGAELPLAGGECVAQGLVLYITGEDDPEDTLKPRIRLQGGDVSRVAFLTPKELVGFNVSGPMFRAVAGRAVAKMKERYPAESVRVVIIDPPTSFLAGVDENSNSEVRGVLTPMKEWADEHDCSVALNAHTNKGSGKNLEAQLRVLGSVAWVNVPRVANIVLKDPEDPKVRLFIPLKTNIGGQAKALSFRIIPDANEPKRARLEWIAEVDVDAQAVMEPPGEKEPTTKKEKVERWLLKTFRACPVWRTSDLDDALQADTGFVIDSMFATVRDALKIKTRKVGKIWETYVDDDWVYSYLPE